jgi:hypothetical protein
MHKQQEVVSMQINGVNEFLSRIASLNGAGGVRGNAFLPGLAPQGQAGHDILLLSDIGKRLSFGVEKAPLLNGNQETGITDPVLKQKDKYLSQQMDILEKMHKLATAAQDENLTDLERVEMQLQFEELRKDMNESAGMPRGYWTKEAASGDFSRLFGDGSSVVERMRNRIMNGEEWNIREAWSPEGFSRAIYNDDGAMVGVEEFAAGWHVVDDKNANVLRARGGDDGTIKTSDTGKKVPTVREVLERETTINFMDAESAANGAKLLEQKINDVQKSRDRIAKAAAEQPNRTWTVVEVNGLMSHDLKPFFGGIGATFVENYLHSDGVYDSAYVLRNIVFATEETFFSENKPASPHNAAATGPLYYRNNILTELAVNQ